MPTHLASSLRYRDRRTPRRPKEPILGLVGRALWAKGGPGGKERNGGPFFSPLEPGSLLLARSLSVNTGSSEDRLRRRPHPAGRHTPEHSLRCLTRRPGPHPAGALPRLLCRPGGYGSGVSEEYQESWSEYFGLRRPPRGVPRSRFARVFGPGRDSTRSDLKLLRRISLALVLLFALGAVTESWVGRICAVGPILIFSMQTVRSFRLLRNAPPDPA
jgi:hypothetical protein